MDDQHGAFDPMAGKLWHNAMLRCGLSLCDSVCTVDHRWFERHHGCDSRKRPHVLDEFEGQFDEDYWYPGEVLVVRIARGIHIRCLLNLPGAHSLDLLHPFMEGGEFGEQSV